MRTFTVSPNPYGVLAERRLAALREIDSATHDALRMALPGLRETLAGDSQLAELVELLAQIAADQRRTERRF